MPTTDIDTDHISSKKNSETEVPQELVLDLHFSWFILMILIYPCSNKLGFYLFADNKNLLIGDKALKSLETVVNTELKKCL